MALGNDRSQRRSHTFTGSPRREVWGKNPKIWWKAQRMSSAPPGTNHKCNFYVLHMELIVLNLETPREIESVLSSLPLLPTLYDGPWPLPLFQLWILFRVTHSHSFDFHSKVDIPNSSSSIHPQVNSPPIPLLISPHLFRFKGSISHTQTTANS